MAERITPACAGNTFKYLKNDSGTKDHPRLCGEYYIRRLENDGEIGSPPPVRGILPFRQESGRVHGITPACAGNTLKKSCKYALFLYIIIKINLVLK